MPKPATVEAVRSLLRDGRRHTASGIAQRLECSERTVRRCVDHLRDVEKWPIESGPFGFRLRKPSTAEVTVSGIDGLAFLAAAAEVLRALESSALAESLREEIVTRCREAIDLGPVPWGRLDQVISSCGGRRCSAKANRIFAELLLAALRAQPCRIGYRRLEEEIGYLTTIFPHRWIQRECGWYLVAHDLERSGQRLYALPRITAAQPLPRPCGFEAPVSDDRHERAFGVWAGGGDETHEVRLEIRGYWARLARERQWHPSQQVRAIESDHVEVRFEVNELVEIKSWVLGLGNAATVLGPPELIEMVVKEAEALIANHGRLGPV